MTNPQRIVRIRSQTDIHSAVHAVRELATRIGMSTGSSAAIATAVSELVTNVVKYADSGRLTFYEKKRLAQPGIEVVVEDSGPGIRDIDKAMSDNVSTGGTLGLGLPGAKRLVDEFEIVSKPSEGTRVRVVKWG
jgi:serine/threonine-protein kinase RsbT